MTPSRLLITTLVNPMPAPCVVQVAWITRRFGRDGCGVWGGCCAAITRKTMGGKIELVVHTAWTLATNTEAVTQAVQLPHPTLGAAVQCEYQVAGQRIAADALRCDAVSRV
jgi:hypothetical protein